jgi:hypothetical protein
MLFNSPPSSRQIHPCSLYSSTHSTATNSTENFGSEPRKLHATMGSKFGTSPYRSEYGRGATRRWKMIRSTTWWTIEVQRHGEGPRLGCPVKRISETIVTTITTRGTQAVRLGGESGLKNPVPLSGAGTITENEKTSPFRENKTSESTRTSPPSETGTYEHKSYMNSL